MSGLAPLPPAKRAKKAEEDDGDDLGSVDSYSSDGSDTAGSLENFIEDDAEDEYQVGGECNVVAGGTQGMSRFMTTIANIEKKVVQSHNKRKLAAAGKQGGGAAGKAAAARAPAAKAPAAKAPAAKPTAKKQ